MSRRIASGDDGVTLIELLVTMTVMAIVVGAVGIPLILGLRTTKDSSAKLEESNDAELLTVRLPADIQSVSPTGVDTAPGTATGCASDPVSAGTSNVIRLQWSQSVPSVVNYSAAYRFNAATHELFRVFCTAATLETSRVAGNLSSVGTPAITGREIKLTLTADSGYTYSITGYRRTPGP